MTADLFLVSAERMKTMDAGRMNTADLVVEILSPGSAMYDRTAKADTYAALGVAELWLVDLETRTIEQRVLRAAAWEVAGTFAEDAEVMSATFAGLRVIPERIFP
ncbi:MAG: Uma2 family endonuclease [Candidatus Binatia bacterium]